MAGISNAPEDVGPRLPSQGGNTTAPTQMPKTSGTPQKVSSAPLTPQDYRGYKTTGIGATNTTVGNSVPQPKGV